MVEKDLTNLEPWQLRALISITKRHYNYEAPRAEQGNVLSLQKCQHYRVLLSCAQAQLDSKSGVQH